jgi:hypothetical protein
MGADTVKRDTAVYHLVATLGLIGFVHNEADGLTLFNVVKTNYPNVGVGVLRAAFPHFREHFLSRSTTKHWQFPHGPKMGIGQGIFFKFHTGDKTLVDQVLNLFDDLLIG